VKTSIPRLRRIRMKSGGAELEVLRQEYLSDKAHIADRTAALIETFFSDEKLAAGFALIIWNPDGGHLIAESTFVNSPIPKAVVPDFMRNALLAKFAREA
jgi:hypothetical protein